MLLAPGLFSTTIVWPNASCSLPVSRRVTVSVIPPGVYGTTQRICRVGYGSAAAAQPATSASSNARQRFQAFIASPPWSVSLHRERWADLLGGRHRGRAALPGLAQVDVDILPPVGARHQRAVVAH